MLQDIFINSLNGFSSKEIPFFIFQLILTGLLVHVFQFLWKINTKEPVSTKYTIVGVVFAFIAVVAKYSVPFAILALAIILWAKNGKNDLNRSSFFKLIIGLIGIGIGSANVILTLGFFLLLCLLLWLGTNRKDEKGRA
ncbi:hypothetical protein DNU06_05285 [Putridiphycobacter roseus]|uniref:DUF4956 domain-containing protein n=1 Tax=Putridiphycobacter roseus TaxID=2219161 RepID=A0A2W1NQV0_9FLAO|nr:hypothetical protein [Putridiphycobacter roseus]PZE18032.1 hypothetical protein DNU06_05285 [Putridiphycobacter roseus]